jgi:ATP-binding cassette subfamily B protein
VIHADEIIVLNEGNIAERGNHLALIANAGLYAGMWSHQQETGYAREILEQAGVNGAPKEAAAQ